MMSGHFAVPEPPGNIFKTPAVLKRFFTLCEDYMPPNVKCDSALTLTKGDSRVHRPARVSLPSRFLTASVATERTGAGNDAII